MQITRYFLAAALALYFPALPADSQQQGPPVRDLGPVTATTSELRSILGVRALSTGQVLVNDAQSRRVLLFEPGLSGYTVVADSTSATGNAYSGQFAGLVPYAGDSTLFVDPMSMSMLVLDPMGKVARVMSVPRTQDAAALTGMMGATQYDPAGRLVYRSFGFGMRGAATPGGQGGPGIMRGGPGAGGGAFSMAPEIPDSAAIVRVDLATRRLDTVAFIRTPPVRMRVSRSDDGTVTMQSEINPLPVVDDWGVLDDGTVVIVRGADYRVEYIAPDGSVRPAVKIPFEWQRLSDDDKVEFMDSVKVAFERRRAAGEVGVPGMGGFGGAGGPQIVMRQRAGPGGAGPGGAPGGGAPGGSNPTGMPMPEINFVPPDQLPDYRPAFFAGALRVDADGNLWVRTTRSTAGKGPIYDVISREGQLVDRVQIPADRTIAGFAPGVVYLSSRDGEGSRLEVASLR